jgi:ABC-type dipeptide/oligopeptide/nickel transport system ATPase component
MNETARQGNSPTQGNSHGVGGEGNPIVRVNDLAVSFDNGRGPRVQAVDGVRMSIYPRQTLAVVGESGCGKSVTAMSMLRLVPMPPGRIDRGSIWFDSSTGSVDLAKLTNRQMRDIRGNDIAMIFQEPMTSLNPVYTVGDQITEAIRLHRPMSKSQAYEVAIEAMESVGIPEPHQRIKAYPHQFSGGMRQRVMISMALACQPRLLLADEPTTALDVTIQAQILELLTDLKASRGMAVMLITHDLGVVAENADVVCVMYAGRVVEYATVFDLFDNPTHPYTRGLLASIPKLHERTERLVTIKEVVDNEDEFRKLKGAEQGIRPWWPWHNAPADLAPQPGPAGDYTLQEVKSGHWVGVWRTEAVAQHETPFPELSFRKEPKAAAALS